MIHIYLSKRNLIILLMIVVIACAAPVIAQYCVQDPTAGMGPHSLHGTCKINLYTGACSLGFSATPAFCATATTCGCEAGYTPLLYREHDNPANTTVNAQFWTCMKN
ncbi:MAG TPA: hypothetical protein P5160_08430 [Candidatus Omnitrophota bacterium]|jgi:hypothetical protein|nr:hypothetical protein [Candidatus Omnitrophota bacterium]